ncbi:short neuropeptide F [Nasonia vitripennis]|uniref:Short neuropeptide F n=1 Tax=Nasonia vitripennis TaxID=7425 RepID=A0A7M7LU91_NASVI|nr:short neuropeptide F [Nasonia vitripennis]
MIAKGCTWTIVFFVIVGVVSAVENYMDYGNESPNSEKSANLRELYRMLVQRSVDDSGSLRDLAEHLQPRAAERSPSLRLRFGRSYPKYPRSPSLRLRFGRSYPSQVGLLSRLNDGESSAAAFEEN